MSSFLAVADSDVLPLVAVGGGLIVAVIAIVFGTLTSMRKSGRREETRREIAAYVAEGSITPVEAERILRAGGPKTIRESISDVLERHGISV